MIIDIDRLTDFNTTHSFDAETELMNLMCSSYKLRPGLVTLGNVSDWDFTIEDKTFELKISSRSTTNSVMEVGRANGGRSGLSASKADFYLFLNNAGSTGKLRLIRSSELKNYYSIDRPGTFVTETRGDKIGSKLVPLNFKDFNDIMILEMKYDARLKQFDTNTAKTNTYAKRMIHNFLRRI